MCWQTRSTSVMSCSIMRIPIPRSATRPSRTSPKRWLSAGSSPDEGSSSSRSDGLRANARANSNSRPWPVEITAAEPRGFRFNGRVAAAADGNLVYNYDQDRNKGRGVVYEGGGRRQIVLDSDNGRATITVDKSLP